MWQMCGQWQLYEATAQISAFDRRENSFDLVLRHRSFLNCIGLERIGGCLPRLAPAGLIPARHCGALAAALERRA